MEIQNKERKLTFVDYLARTILISFFVLLGLKVFGVIDWSWWWITSPLWIAAILNLFAVIMVYVLMTFLRYIISREEKRLEKDLKD